MSKVDAGQAPAFAGESPGYEADFCAWSAEQARRIRLLHIPGIDVENVAEEIDSLGRSIRAELSSRMSVLVMHLLKWRYQHGLSGRSWQSSILVQRTQIRRLLKESPSLRPTVPHVIEEEYPAAVERAMVETGLLEDTFPAGCEWSVDEILAADYFPDPPS